MPRFILNFQETALNHVKTAGLLGDGFGATPEMSKRNLIWVVSKIQLLVEKYPLWYVSANLNNPYPFLVKRHPSIRFQSDL